MERKRDKSKEQMGFSSAIMWPFLNLSAIYSAVSEEE
jgi:hypothetical protein